MTCRASILTLMLSLCYCSCSSERVVYGADGEVVKERKAGESPSLEARFTGSFNVKKNKDGVPEASSAKVSPFQSQIDAARSADNKDAAGAAGKQFGGRQDISDLRDKGYGGASTQFNGGKTYEGSNKSAYTADNVPDFMKPGKGLERKDYDKGKVASDTGRQFAGGGTYQTAASPTNQEQKSGYFESRRDKTAPPVIMSKDEYQRMTLEESRGMLGR